MGRSYKQDDWSYDRDAATNPEFYSDAEAISVVEFVPSSEIELSDEEKTEETVAVRFGDDGFAYAVEASKEEPRPGKRAKEIASEPLELMPQPKSIGITSWSQDFAEMHARAQEFKEVSKISTCRWEHHGDGKKISCKPSAADFLCDVCITAKRVLSPAMYRIWLDTFYEGYGENADSLPKATMVTIMQRTTAAWKKSGLMPFGAYWNHPTPANKPSANLLEQVEEEQRIAAREQRRKTLRKKRRQAEKETTLAVSHHQPCSGVCCWKRGTRPSCRTCAM